MNLPKNSTYNGYTLLEMLIVLLVFIIISGIGIAGFLGFRDTVAINEDVNTLKQKISLAQRSALFLERSASERWLYGIGIDFSQISTTGKYTVFKWCSQFDEFGDPLTKASMPNFNTGNDLGPANGNIGVNNKSYGVSRCSLSQPVNEIVRLDFSFDDSISPNFQVSLPDINIPGDAADDKPEYLLFESVSGKAYFYDRNGKVVNYGGRGVMVNNPINMVIEVTSNNTKTRKRVVISNISGKVNVENQNL